MTKRVPDYTDYRYVGKNGKLFTVTDGIFVKHLTAKEFRVFSRQLFGYEA